MSISSVPQVVQPIPLNRSIRGLTWKRSALPYPYSTWPVNSIEGTRPGKSLERSVVELEQDGHVIIGPVIGEGRQAVVYAIETANEACLKVGKNESSAKQLRREVWGASTFKGLAVKFPTLLGADRFGRWILKTRWFDVESGESALRSNKRILPQQYVVALANYVRVFEEAELCVDWTPSNVVFYQQKCATFETPIWPRKTHPTWSFRSCFLPLWLPDGFPESSLLGFPPYAIMADRIESLKAAWQKDAKYKIWRDLFGEFPVLAADWWIS